MCLYGELWKIIPKSSLLPVLFWSTAEPIKKLSNVYCLLRLIRTNIHGHGSDTKNPMVKIFNQVFQWKTGY